MSGSALELPGFDVTLTWVCIALALVVYALMIYSIATFRRAPARSWPGPTTRTPDPPWWFPTTRGLRRSRI